MARLRRLNSADSNHVVQTQQTAAYIADLSGDLALLARRHGLGTLAYLLDIARLEAQKSSAAGSTP